MPGGMSTLYLLQPVRKKRQGPAPMDTEPCLALTKRGLGVQYFFSTLIIHICNMGDACFLSCFPIT